MLIIIISYIGIMFLLLSGCFVDILLINIYGTWGKRNMTSTHIKVT